MNNLKQEAQDLAIDAEEIVKKISSPHIKDLVAKLARSYAILYVNIMKEEEK